MSLNSSPAMTQHPSIDEIAIGHDILSLISSAMYTEPLTVYRELVQNSTDAIDDAIDSSVLSVGEGCVQIAVDPLHRSIIVRDNGSGISNDAFAKTMCSIGSSRKRGSKSRGFRGIGRLVGLGYCRELLFRSRSETGERVFEAAWDCRQLREELRSTSRSSLSEVIASVVTISSRKAAQDDPAHFFEVELRGVVRLANDGLLHPELVAHYLSEVGPVPFSDDFKYGRQIEEFLVERMRHSKVNIEIAGISSPIVRPYRNQIALSSTKTAHLDEPTFFEIPSQDGDQGTIGWICHHEYFGAFSRTSGIRGLRARVGNLQIGEENCFDYIFTEPRFNSWTIGEAHVLDERIVPNGRRDDFEPNVHYENLCNHMIPVANDIASRCRSYSLSRRKARSLDELDRALGDYRKLLKSNSVARILRDELVDDVRVQIEKAKKRSPGKAGLAKLARVESQVDVLASTTFKPGERSKARDLGRAEVLRLMRDHVPGGIAYSIELMKLLEDV